MTRTAAALTARRRTTRRIAALAATALTVTLLALPTQTDTAVAATPATAWGPDGQTQSDSAVTVRWDNVGNAPESVVPRDATQVVPHTGGKTYANISAKVRDGYASMYGAENGLGGLEFSVSQTQNLVNQSVTVSFRNAKAGPIGTDGEAWFEVFQCWGAMGPDGKPDPAATSPSPDTCQVGVGGPDTGDPNYGQFDGDKMAAGGDLAGNKVKNIPFHAIDGTITNRAEASTFFNRVTTNELSLMYVQAGGVGTRSFEMQTGAEAPGLNCGFRADVVSTSSCWLVVVPVNRNYSLQDSTGIDWQRPSGVAPTLWAQRMQVKLGFQDVAATCPSGQAQTLATGSEVLSAAMTSWLPAICDSTGVALGFTQLSDYQARQQLTGGSAKLAFGSQPVSGEGVVQSPAALGGVAVGVTLDYRPCGREASTPEAVQQVVDRCKYPDAAAAQTEIDKNGSPITEIKLNSRLITKLLTMSYEGQLYNQLGSSMKARAPWFSEQPSGLFGDEEFLALNPTLKYQDMLYDLSRVNVENLRSDAANSLWKWIASDPASKTFLDGCPDAYGTVINPFYSTRSYAECQTEASALSVAAAAKIEATHSPVGFDQTRAPAYPPADTAYGQVLWYQQDAFEVEPGKVDGKATLVDLFPPVASMPVAAKVAFQAAPLTPKFCKNDARYECSSNNLNGEWKGIASRQDVGNRAVLSIVSTADAARFQLPTASICDSTGAYCVGATEQSLQAGAAAFVPDATTGMMLPPATIDYAAGAYPLAMLVYGVVNTKGLPQTQANSIASALEYIAGAGQVPGARSGMLPAGYAPLPASLVAQAGAAISKLRNPPVAAASAPAAAAAPTGPRSGVVPKAVAVPTAVTQPAVDTALPEVVRAGGTTPETEIGFPHIGLILGLVAALLAGALSPFFGRRKRVSA